MSRPLVIVTRPPEDAPPLVAALEAIGCDTLLAPMIEIMPVEPRPEIRLDGIQAFLVTSANGVRALAAALGPAPVGRGIAVLAVGEASAAAAKQADFEIVEAAAGDVAALAALVEVRCNPAHGRLVHAAGRTVAGDLKGALEAKGFTVERIVLYDAVPVAALTAEAAGALHEERCFGVLFFSPRTAETFVTLVKQAGLGEQAPQLAALCLSEAVAEAARALPWRRVVVAAEPRQAALVEALREALAAETPAGRPEDRAGERGSGMAEREAEVPGPAREQPEADEPAQASPRRASRPAISRRRFSWLVGVIALAAIGGGLYAAWPAITGKDEAPVPVAEEAAEPPLASATPPAELGPAEAEAPPEVPAEEPAAPVAEQEAQSTPRAEPSPEPAEAEPAAPAEADVGAAPAQDNEIAVLRARLDALEQRAAEPEEPAGLAALNERLDRLERQTAMQGGGGTGEDAALAARLSTLEKRVADAELATSEAAALRERLAAVQDEAAGLGERVATLENRAREDLRLVALVEAKAALGAAAREGARLGHELKDLQAVLPADAPIREELATLARFEAQGAPSYDALRARFPALAREIVKAEAAPGEDAGWVDQTIARLESIVTVRKKGGALEPDSVDERLVRAERALSASDGDAALAALDGLEGGEALTAFREDLSQRVALDRAVRAVERYVTGLAAERLLPPADDGP